MRNSYCYLWLLLLLPFFSSAQGKLLLVGGGREDYGSWNDAPYKWAIERSQNKKVVIVGYSSGTDWYETYFTSLGASEAYSITLGSRAEADAPEAYEQLMAADLIFFRGGDQNKYYTLYKGTRTQQALLDKYAAGGVLGGTSAGMAILSGVIYTAANGSLQPEEALQNINSTRHSLAADFLPFYPGYVFDTHFLERGRFPRLLAFMAHWHQQTGESLTGIGIDDKTAFGIDASGLGTAWGTGAVSIYKGGHYQFTAAGSWDAEAVVLQQLLHGMQVNLASGILLNSLPRKLNEEEGWISWQNPLLLSGGESAADNRQMLTHLLKKTGSPTDSILILSPNDSSLAHAYKQELMQQGQAAVSILQANAANNGSNRAWALERIKTAKKILIQNSSYSQIDNFIKAGPAGSALQQRWQYPGVVLAFVGNGSLLAGEVFPSNYLQDPAIAYNGTLDYQQGFGMLASCLLMPMAFTESLSDYHENQVASLHHGMAQNSLRWGLVLGKGSFVVLEQKGNRNELTAYAQPALLLHNRSGKAVAATAGERNTAAFDGLEVHLMPLGHPFEVGVPQAAEPPLPENPTGFEDQNNIEKARIRAINQGWHISWGSNIFLARLLDVHGRQHALQQGRGTLEIRPAGLARGIYILTLQDLKGAMYRKKIFYSGHGAPK